MVKQYILYTLIIIVIASVPFLVYKSQNLKRSYNKEVTSLLEESNKLETSILTENDLTHLPEIVQKYLRYVGVVGKEKVKNIRVVGEGEFKPGNDKEWSKVTPEQYNTFDNIRRVYFMKLNMFGLPVIGLHVYKNVSANMRIKAAGLITVMDVKGEKMNQAETVTVFNDMCLLAPAALIDKRITWETISPLTVKANFNNNGVKISASLYFNQKGELINFVSNDRFMTPDTDTYISAPWSTPVKDYRDYGGVKLASYGEAHWSLPEGDYCYGKIFIKEIEYNIKSIK